MSGDFKTIDSESIFKGVIVDLSIDTIESPSGRIMKREVIKHMDAVGIAAINANNQIVLVRQYSILTVKLRNPVRKENSKKKQGMSLSP
jgi:hypothetical protein